MRKICGIIHPSATEACGGLQLLRAVHPEVGRGLEHLPAVQAALLDSEAHPPGPRQVTSGAVRHLDSKVPWRAAPDAQSRKPQPGATPASIPCFLRCLVSQKPSMHMVCEAVDHGSRSVNGFDSVSQHVEGVMSQVPSPEDAVFEDPLEHLVCMECAGVQDEDLILLCDGATPLCCLVHNALGSKTSSSTVSACSCVRSELGASAVLQRRPNEGSWAAGCNQGCHTYCAHPPLDGVPAGAWYCSVCAPTLAAPHPRGRASRGRSQRAASPGPVSTMLIPVCICLPCQGRILLASVVLIPICHAPALGNQGPGELSEGAGAQLSVRVFAVRICGYELSWEICTKKRA